MKDYDDSNWREEYKNYTISKKELDLLDNGAKKLTDSWYLSALYQRWKKIMGHHTTEPPDCSSSFLEWEKKVKDIDSEDA